MVKLHFAEKGWDWCGQQVVNAETVPENLALPTNPILQTSTRPVRASSSPRPILCALVLQLE